jgi:hypothetical protein
MPKTKNQKQKPAPIAIEKPKVSDKKPWYKKVWTLGVAAVGVIAAIGLKGPEVVDGLRKLPATISSAYEQFSTWKSDDAEWVGVWSNNTEGYVDSEDMRISATEMRFEIESTRGVLTGVVASRKICKSLPIFNFVLIDGKTSFSSADVDVFDFVGGRRQLFAKLKLQRDGPVLIVKAVDDPAGWFGERVRLARSAVHDQATHEKTRDTFCSAEKAEWMRKNLANPKR